MLPICFVMGILLRKVWDAEPKTTSKTRIKRDHFNVGPNVYPDQRHKPGDDTHSVILETVEKRLWKIYITDEVHDFLDVAVSKTWFLVFLMLVVSAMGLVKVLVPSTEPQQVHFTLEEKLEALIDPYQIQFFTGVIVLCIVWLIWHWLAKRLRLLKAIRSRNYTYKIMTK